MNAVDVLSIVRDVLLIISILLLLAVLWKISGLLRSIRETLKRMEDVAETVSSGILGPVMSGSGVAFGIGKLAAFVLGFSKKRNSKGGKDNGKR